jgi:signal transduction histidine kinase
VPRRRYATRSPLPPLVADPQAQRALFAVREIVHAFIRADRPEEVFQFALDRVSFVVGASFAAAYLVDGASGLMRLVAAHNWPDQHRAWLGATQVRVGSGPSGEAASERRAIEIPDVFADPDLQDWQEVARELGFRAVIALPLQTARGVLGTVTFYFGDLDGLTTEGRAAMRIVADHMAATAEKQAAADDMRRTDAALVEANAELERQYVAVVEANRIKDEFLANVSYELRAPLSSVIGYLSLLREEISGPLTPEQRAELAQASSASDQLLELIDTLLEFTALRRGTLQVRVEEFDPREPLRDAMRTVKGRPDAVQLIADEPAQAMDAVRSDRRKVTRILTSLLSNAFKFTSEGEVRASVAVANGRVEYRVQDTGIGIEPAAQLLVFEEFRQVDGTATRQYGGTGLGLALSRGVARLLGGDIELVSAPAQGSTFTLRLPLVFDPTPRSSATRDDQQST